MDHDSVLFIYNDKHKIKFSSLQEGHFKQFSNFRHKVIYSYSVMIKNAKRKLEYDCFKRANICM